MAEEMIVVGIAGGSASGKTTLAEKLKDYYYSASILSMDDYYKETEILKELFPNGINYDHPDAFDFEALANDIRRLKNGESIDIYPYNYKFHAKSKQCVKVYPADILIVEGLYSLYCKPITNELTLKIFVDAENTVRLNRRIERDVAKRGRCVEDIIIQYNKYVFPMYAKYIQPAISFADVVIDGTECIDISVNKVIRNISELMH